MDKRQILPDSTFVCRNSNTKFSYPSVFATNNRKVKLDGEAYFEVSANNNKPFYVHTSKGEIDVYKRQYVTHGECYMDDPKDYSRDFLAVGGTFQGESWKRIGFTRQILDALPNPCLLYTSVRPDKMPIRVFRNLGIWIIVAALMRQMLTLLVI